MLEAGNEDTISAQIIGHKTIDFNTRLQHHKARHTVQNITKSKP